MPSNIEIKARVSDLEPLRRTVMSIATQPCQVLDQEDVFFHTPRGRLKLRSIRDAPSELIFYERPDTSEAKRSDYEICPVPNPGQLRQLLASALGETATVRKRRMVFQVGQTRVHLDEVEKLGTFLELEVVLRGHQHPEEGRRIASRLMEQLGVNPSDLVPCAYADLLRQRARQDPTTGAP